MKAYLVTTKWKMCYYLLGFMHGLNTLDRINSWIVRPNWSAIEFRYKNQLFFLLPPQSHAVTYQVHSIVLSDVNVLLPVSVSLCSKKKKRLFLTFEYKSVAIWYRTEESTKFPYNFSFFFRFFPLRHQYNCHLVMKTSPRESFVSLYSFFKSDILSFPCFLPEFSFGALLSSD